MIYSKFALPSCLGGLTVSVPVLSDAENLLATGTGLGGQPQRGTQNHSFAVPTFVSTLALPSMSSFVCSTTNVCSSQNGVIHDVAVHFVA